MQTRKGKWQPFDALEGYKEALRKVDYQIAKIPKPILSIDELEMLDDNLKEALRAKKVVEIVYYEEGYVYKKYDQIKGVDLEMRKIKVGVKKLPIEDIIEINLCS